ncbi:glycogen-binding subunit 76A-like isoform X2 [Lytechinus pictus]|uniref:glycogen-binding subunit 76A-like isoform X2 n=1 Tax=Lytechinus pictus TaxID=7653 RepID=UPI0030B9DD1F
MPGVLIPLEVMATAENEVAGGDALEGQQHLFHSTTAIDIPVNGPVNQHCTKPDSLTLQKYDDLYEHVSTPGCSPVSSPLHNGDINDWINDGTPTNDSSMKCFSPIASDEAGACSSSEGTYTMCPQAHPDLDWDELFALTDYMGVANKSPYFGSNNNNNCLSLVQNNRTLTSPPKVEHVESVSSSCSDLFDVFINPAAYSASDESEEGLSSVDSESTLSETDSDASSSRPRKSSMRKRPRTPLGNPSRKSVTFADALGLDLQTVRHILEMDPCPSPPMTVLPLDSSCQTISKSVHLCFEQPGGRPDFLQRLCQQNICLENAMISDMTIIGTIKVRNLDFCKEVRVRYSWDNWATHANIMARYVAGSCDGPTDRFSFGFTIPRRYVGVGDRVFFAVFYKVANQEYWDNNNGFNYMLLIDEEVKTKDLIFHVKEK